MIVARDARPRPNHTNDVVFSPVCGKAAFLLVDLLSAFACATLRGDFVTFEVELASI